MVKYARMSIVLRIRKFLQVVVTNKTQTKDSFKCADSM